MINMELILLLVYISFLMTVKSTENQKSIDEELGSKTQFDLFENFDACKITYLKEKYMLQEISDLKNIYTNVKHQLKKSNILLSSMKENIENILHIMSQIFRSITQESYANLQDFKSAKKAILMLYYAYNFDLPATCKYGKLIFTNQYNQEKVFQAYEQLSIGDLENLASVAYDQGSYDHAIEIVDAIMEVQGSSNNTKMLSKKMQKFKKILIRLNNGYLTKHQTFIGDTFRTLPYLVNYQLKPKKNQPEFVKNKKKLYENSDGGINGIQYSHMKTCQKEKWFSQNNQAIKLKQICRYLHHKDSYLKLGPFKEEHITDIPSIVVFHDILTENEMTFLKEETRPYLSQKREFQHHNSGSTTNYEIKSGERRRIFHKTVQAWLREVEWPNLTTIEDYSGTKYLKMNYPILWKLNKKISLATQLRTDLHSSGSYMQVTNYGVGGTCDAHIDPKGIMEMKHVEPEMYVTGDVVGTIMGWLDDTEAGGGTAYIYPGIENVLLPEKGAAAFFKNLYSSGHIDFHSYHGGCPVLKGSKWILNKWLCMYDNFKKFPCQLSPKMRFIPTSHENYY